MRQKGYNGVLVLSAAAALGAFAAWHSAFAHEEQHFSAGEPGDPKKPARIVSIAMRESGGRMLFVPDRVEVRRGEQVRFVLNNAGELQHEFMIATPAENAKHAALMRKYPDMEHDDANGRSVQPKRKAELVWRFTKLGAFEFACLVPGHYEAGMRGTIIVK